MTRADYIAVTLALLLLPFLYAHFWQAEGVADTVRITARDGTAVEYPLAENRTLNIDGPLGHSTVEIRGGQVRFVDSPCPGQQCVHTGWLHHAGELAACLPNRITVALAGREPRFDAINF